ncbi:hypothetical protein LPN01_08835 [Sphingomonas sp. A2-49]|uniref:DUF4139 domain-containing protein n=1 Tax=Sphingomonas sp. A2-49 TaxID=1391375 RepID=UPI0021D2BC5B|nr:hypothetical protein [Sphingomonas sp. A2-49]MCU6454181.1 hypothetical protein [Sphingomonas sp. A2-49]
MRAPLPAVRASAWSVVLGIAAIGTAGAQTAPATIVSAGPQTVAVTVYRNPARGRYEPIDRDDLQGFALVTETRTVRLPRGPAVLRFEGVAEGIVPVSAIVDGLPGGTIEKNRDARLLSPAALVDGTLGRNVTVTRTDRATGRRRSEPATIVAGPRPGVVLRTASGIEALRCAGLPEGPAYDRVPAGLSAKPVLSVATDTPAARTATVTLSYLASGFDWGASYVASVAPDGRTLDLFAWLTLANGNPERFADARVRAVAGRLNRRGTERWVQAAAALQLRCYPLGTTTSDLPTITRPSYDEDEEAQDIVVTGSRIMPMMMMAPPPPPPPAPVAPPPPEDLGDLKLYTVPRATTVAPRGQKQVALLAATDVPFERRYRRAVYPGQTLDAADTAIVLVARNRPEDRLGMPLPAGTTALYTDLSGAGRATRLLLGTGTLGDRAIGERVRIAAGTSTQVTVAQRPLRAATASASGARPGDAEDRLTVVNANARPVDVELPIGRAGQGIAAVDGTPMDGDLAEVDGIATWQVRVPANGTATLAVRYR